MRWSHFAALAITLAATANGFAQQPGMPMSVHAQGGSAGQSMWWARFNTQPNGMQPMDMKELPGPAMETIHSPMYGGHSGYAYHPGACDYTPPCTENLWAGYSQHLHRCTPYQGRRHFGCRGGCGQCGRGGNACSTCNAGSCSAPAASCGCTAPVGEAGKMDLLPASVPVPSPEESVQLRRLMRPASLSR